MYHPSKHNTLNNITNIEELALYSKTPDDITKFIEDDKQFEKLLCDIVKLGDLTQIDIQVLGALKTRREAAKELNISYSAYRNRLWRKCKKIREKENK